MNVKHTPRERAAGRGLLGRTLAMSLAVASAVSLVAGLATALATAHTNGCVAGPHSGEISFSQEWCLADSPHHVHGWTWVIPGVTVTIEPGVVVVFEPGYSRLSVDGTLIAEGTPGAPILFTSEAPSPQPGDWQGLNAAAGSHVSLAYWEERYAGYPTDYAFYIWSSDVQVRHSRIRDSVGDGISIAGAGLTPLFEDVEIDHVTEFPIHQYSPDQNPTYVNVRLHDNGTDAVRVETGTVDRDVTMDGSPAALNGAPFYCGTVYVQTGKTLTVTPGTTIRFAPGADLGLDGALMAVGTPTNRITITAQAASPQPADHWGKIYATSGSQAQLSYCDIRYGGAPSMGGRALWIRSSNVDIAQCLVDHSYGDGLFVDNGAQFSLRNVALVDHGGSGLAVLTGAIVDGAHLTLARNATGVYVDGGSTAHLANTIVANNAIGVEVVAGGHAHLDHTLWDSNAISVVGTIIDLGHVDGPAEFDGSGYHILPASAAVQRGLNLGWAVDIDGDPRPMPVGTSPDLGADENPIRRYFYTHLPVALRQYP